jgi:antitoxin component of RelBE/YafQ-DinJ toxin-antitoxin module
VEEILDEIGINLSTMFNVYMKRVVKYRAVETGLERVMVNSLDELEDKLKKALKSKEVPLEKSSIFKKLKFD